MCSSDLSLPLKSVCQPSPGGGPARVVVAAAIMSDRVRTGTSLFTVRSSGECGSRKLGKSEVLERDNDVLFAITMNDAKLSRDLCSRTIPINLHFEGDPMDRMFSNEFLLEDLKRRRTELLSELAGMVEHCDFYEQEHTPTDEGAIRPDMIVRMPGGREIVIDVKTPLDAYLNAIEATDDVTRQQALEHHSRKMRERVLELAGKAYWKQFKNSPDFVVLFIPGEHFLSAALEQNPGLLEEALSKKVILATPTSLVALLRAIAFGWNQQSITKNAEKIRDLGEDLYKRIATFTNHLAKLGSHLSSSVDNYNKAIGSFERQVLSGARKFTDMGIKATKPLEQLEPLDKSVRQITEGKVEE